MSVDDWFDDDEDDEDEREDMHLENMCIEPGCLSDGSHGSCGLCGGALCFRHEEILAGFCTTCSELPDFSEQMHRLYGEVGEDARAL
jgi:hypothetical protein